MEDKKSTLKKYNGLTKLADNEKKYKKPPQTVAEKLSQEDIANLLVNYQEVKIKDLKKGVHTRYYKKNKEGGLDFKLGGMLLKVDESLKYVVLMSNGLTWSAQADSIFYQEMSYKEKIEEQEKENNVLMSYIKTLQKNIIEKDQIIKQQESTIKKLSKKNNIT